MRCFVLSTLVALLSFGAPASATTITFDTDPFAGSDALTMPGRQIVGGEAFVSFSIGSDVFAFDPQVFDVDDQVLFANDVAGNLPTSSVNVVVLQTLDNDNDAATPFGAATAANLIADRITSSGPGFFVYFNSGLDLPRLVYTTDLSENTADLKILARMTNLGGQSGLDALPLFTAANFAMIAAPSPVPEPASWALLMAPVALWGLGRVMGRRARSRPHRG